MPRDDKIFVTARSAATRQFMDRFVPRDDKIFFNARSAATRQSMDRFVPRGDKIFCAAVSDVTVARQRWVLRKVLQDAAHQSIGELLLISLAAQFFLFFWVADEGGLDQHTGDVGGF